MQVLNANLEWTPMHTSTQFWKENAGKLADNNCQLLKVLLNLLKAGREVSPALVPRHWGLRNACGQELLTCMAAQPSWCTRAGR